MLGDEFVDFGEIGFLDFFGAEDSLDHEGLLFVVLGRVIVRGGVISVHPVLRERARAGSPSGEAPVP